MNAARALRTEASQLVRILAYRAAASAASPTTTTQLGQNDGGVLFLEAVLCAKTATKAAKDADSEALQAAVTRAVDER